MAARGRLNDLRTREGGGGLWSPRGTAAQRRGGEGLTLSWNNLARRQNRTSSPVRTVTLSRRQVGPELVKTVKSHLNSRPRRLSSAGEKLAATSATARPLSLLSQLSRETNRNCTQEKETNHCGRVVYYKKLSYKPIGLLPGNNTTQ